jgi:hypothetical protein
MFRVPKEPNRIALRHTTMTRSNSALVLIVLVALAACGGGEVGQPDPSPVGDDTSTTQPSDLDADIWGFEVPTNPGAVLLEWLSVGGFVPVEYNVGRAPRFVLTAGGELYSEGPMTLEYPGAQLVRFQKVQLNQTQMSAVLEAISNTELVRVIEGSNESANQTVADADTSVFVLHHADGTTSQYSIYAFGIASGDDDVAEFQALADAIEAGRGSETSAAAIERLQVVLSPSGPAEALNPVVDWPFSDIADAPDVFNDVRCFEISGDDLAEAVDLFDGVNSATFYKSAGETWRALVRPLLANEEACVVR